MPGPLAFPGSWVAGQYYGQSGPRGQLLSERYPEGTLTFTQTIVDIEAGSLPGYATVPRGGLIVAKTPGLFRRV